MLRCAGELPAQVRVLGGNADRTGVEVALAHHDAAERDERRRGEAELLGAEQSGNRDIPAGLQLPIRLQHHPRAQVVHDQRLVGLGDAQLPGHAGVLDGGERGCAGATRVARDHQMIGARLGDAGRDRADADLGAELDADACLRVRVLQIVDKLGHILDRVDVVVRRRADKSDARGRVADPGDFVVDLASRQLPRLRRASRPARS